MMFGEEQRSKCGLMFVQNLGEAGRDGAFGGTRVGARAAWMTRSLQFCGRSCLTPKT